MVRNTVEPENLDTGREFQRLVFTMHRCMAWSGVGGLRVVGLAGVAHLADGFGAFAAGSVRHCGFPSTISLFAAVSSLSSAWFLR